MDARKHRTEEDLRAALAMAAEDAPSSARVLARVAAAERRQERRRGRRLGVWAPLVGIAVIVIAIAIPIAVLSHFGSHNSGKASSDAAAAAAGSDMHVASSSAAAAGSVAATAVSGPGAQLSPSAAPLVPGATLPLCTPAEVSLTLTWRQDGNALAAALIAANHTAAACDLAVKPAIYPLGTDGTRLGVLDAQTAEGYAGPTRLLPGATASSTLSWNGWCGAAASSQVQVDWGAGVATVTASGPTAPSCVAGAATNITSSWFGPLS